MNFPLSLLVLLRKSLKESNSSAKWAKEKAAFPFPKYGIPKGKEGSFSFFKKRVASFLPSIFCHFFFHWIGISFKYVTKNDDLCTHLRVKLMDADKNLKYYSQLFFLQSLF